MLVRMGNECVQISDGSYRGEEDSMIYSNI